MQIATRASDESWWTNTRSGRLDSANFLLQDKSSSETVAVSSVYGLDLYTTKWGQRAVGIAGIEVPDRHRRKGYAQTLLVETGKRLRQEIIGLMEIQVEESNQAGIALLNSLGFVHVDTGVVYQKVE